MKIKQRRLMENVVSTCHAKSIYDIKGLLDGWAFTPFEQKEMFDLFLKHWKIKPEEIPNDLSVVLANLELRTL